EPPVHERRTVAESKEPLARGSERIRIAIDPDERAVRRRAFEDRLGVSAVAEGAVEDASARSEVEPIEHAREEDGAVIHITLLPARPRPGPRARTACRSAL